MAYQTDEQEGMIAETVAVRGHGGEFIHAYLARPAGPGPFPSVVLFHHMPGWDDWYKEATRTFAHHGYVALTPDLYCREGHGTPEDVGAKVRGDGGVADEQVVGDGVGCIAYLQAQAYSNGKVGVFGTCSGGRHAFLTACLADGVDAAVDLWGGNVVMAEADLVPKRPGSPIDYTKDLTCPLLGIFGNDDGSPTPEQVDQHEAALKEHGKTYEFHRYDGAGHGFFYHNRPAAYRAEQAVDAWGKVFAFLDRELEKTGS